MVQTIKAYKQHMETNPKSLQKQHGYKSKKNTEKKSLDINNIIVRHIHEFKPNY